MLPGFRRVDFVLITGHTARAYGVGHRRPRACPISLATAKALAANGVRVVLR